VDGGVAVVGRQSAVVSKANALLANRFFWSFVTDEATPHLLQNQIDGGGTAMSGSYRDIKAWQKAIELVVEIYSCTHNFTPRGNLRVGQST
jgi:hypothetical protein